MEGAEFFTAGHAAPLKAMLERIDGLTAETASCPDESGACPG